MILNLRIMLGQTIRVQYVDLLEYCSRTWLQKMNTLQIPLFLRVVTTTPQVVREEEVAAVVDLAPQNPSTLPRQ